MRADAIIPAEIAASLAHLRAACLTPPRLLIAADSNC